MKTTEEESLSVRIACKLTSPELQQRKQTVLASLRKQVLESKEEPDGYAYRFQGTDEILDELTSFIKTERQCCDFINFRISIQPDETIWLELTGPSGAKEFIIAELDLIPDK